MLNELIKKNRSYRRYDSSHFVSVETIKSLVNNARLSPSAANLQPLRYVIVNSKIKTEKLFESLKWAAYLKEWRGPSPDERPNSYIIILGDKQFAKYHSVDAGIAAQSILLSAVEIGLGGCIFASGDKERIRKEFEISDDYEFLLVIAIGKPKEEVVLTEIEEGADIKYWRDESSVHYVPKRKLDDIIFNVYSD